MAILEFNATPQVTATVSAGGSKTANFSAVLTSSFTTSALGVVIRQFRANNNGYPIIANVVCGINVAYGSIGIDTANVRVSQQVRINQGITVDFNQTGFTPQFGVEYRVELEQGFAQELGGNQSFSPAQQVAIPGFSVLEFESESFFDLGQVNRGRPGSANFVDEFEFVGQPGYIVGAVSNQDSKFTIDLTYTRVRFSGADVNSQFNTEYPDNFINHKLDRSFQANNVNKIFTNNPLELSSNLDPGSNYQLLISSTNGEFASDGSDNFQTTLTITGNISTINSQIVNLDYYPDKNFRGTDAVTFALLTSTGNLIEKYTTQINYTQDAVINEEFEFTTSVTDFEFEPVYKKYYSTVDLMLVGGGASGAAGFSIGTGSQVGNDERYAGGGGGGGGVFYQENININFNSQQTFVIGQGGTVNKSLWNSQKIVPSGGTSTSGFGYSAVGGLGATPDDQFTATLDDGGNSGYPSVSGSTARTFGDSNHGQGSSAGGGAGGAGGNGGDSTIFGGTPGGDGFTTPFGTFGGGGGGGGGYRDTEQFFAGGNTVTQSPNKNLGGAGGGAQGCTYEDIDPDFITCNPAEDALPNTGGGGGGAGGGWDTNDLNGGYTVNGNGAPGNGGSGYIKFKVNL